MLTAVSIMINWVENLPACDRPALAEKCMSTCTLCCLMLCSSAKKAHATLDTDATPPKPSLEAASSAAASSGIVFVLYIG